MGWWQAVLFGIIQGVTEFLPVSSSGHLAIAHRLGLGTGIPEDLELTFDVLLHGASLIAIIIAFWKDIWDAVYRGPRFWLLILLAVVPTGLAGLLLRVHVQAFARSLFLIGIAYLFTTTLLCLAQWRSKRQATRAGLDDDPASLGLGQACLVGLLQITALFPGVSRSGSTVSAGLLAGMTPRWAVSFSFLVGLPLIAAVTVKDGMSGGYGELMSAVGLAPLLLAFVVCALVSYACIIALKLVVAKRLLHWFAAYCLLLALLCISLSLSQARGEESPSSASLEESVCPSS